jgi:uncharacterized coiled-coil protein SlyX
MKTPIKFKAKTPSLFIALGLALACFGLLPNAHATDVEGSLPNGNNAEGVGVLTSLTTGAWNTGTGHEALHNLTTGNLNTATGLRALFTNNADANTAHGMMALFSNTVGTENVAVGAQALVFNVDGVSNTAAGTQALFANTSGSGNCAFGQWAQSFNTVGDTSNAFGYGSLFNNDTTAINGFGFAALASNVTGPNNAAFGDLSLVLNVIGSANCAFGNEALLNNDSSAAGAGNGNNAFGVQALTSNVDGETNNAFGTFALFSNVSGVWNNAFGFAALSSSTGDFNTAMGDSAGATITTGNHNACFGEGAGNGIVTADNQVAINVPAAGPFADISNTCFIGSIFNQPVSDAGSAQDVFVDQFNVLGFVASTRRVKHDIKPMDKASEMLYGLKPVTYKYNSDKTGRTQFGLIAEEVAEVAPDLVIRDNNGDVQTVRFEQIGMIMLNEFLKEHRTVEQLKSKVAKQEAIIAQQQKGMEVLTAQLKDQAAQIQKVSARLEASRPAPQVVLSTP